jgi:hypothetical protein
LLNALKHQLASLPPHQQQQVLANLSKLPTREREELMALLEEATLRESKAAAQGGLEQFAKQVYPNYIVGAHHRHLFKLLERAANTPNQRIIVNIAPRHGMSEACSYLFPSWYLGHHPDKKVIMATHTADLSTTFGRRVRDLVGSDEYRNIFPDLKLNQDAKAAGAWNTSKGGQYYAVGVGGALAGRGADLCVTPSTKVVSKRGVLPAGDIRVGDWVQGACDWNQVKHVIHSTHSHTVHINKLRCSTTHPIMIVGRGFVPADQVVIGDKIVTQTLLRKCINVLGNSTIIHTVNTIIQAVFTLRKRWVKRG